LKGSNDIWMKIAIGMILVNSLIGFITHLIPIKS